MFRLKQTSAVLLLTAAFFCTPASAFALQFGADSGNGGNESQVTIVSRGVVGEVCTGTLVAEDGGDKNTLNIITARHCVQAESGDRVSGFDGNVTSPPDITIYQPGSVESMDGGGWNGNTKYKVNAPTGINPKEVKVPSSDTDIAVLKVDKNQALRLAVPAQIATLPPKTGDKVTMLGTGSASQQELTQSRHVGATVLGWVKSHNRTGSPNMQLLWTDKPMAGFLAGDSGGGVFDAQGRLYAVAQGVQPAFGKINDRIYTVDRSGNLALPLAEDADFIRSATGIPGLGALQQDPARESLFTGGSKPLPLADVTYIATSWGKDKIGELSQAKVNDSTELQKLGLPGNKGVRATFAAVCGEGLRFCSTGGALISDDPAIPRPLAGSVTGSEVAAVYRLESAVSPVIIPMQLTGLKLPGGDPEFTGTAKAVLASPFEKPKLTAPPAPTGGQIGEAETSVSELPEATAGGETAEPPKGSSPIARAWNAVASPTLWSKAWATILTGGIVVMLVVVGAVAVTKTYDD